MQPISCTRIIGNQHNLVREAVITATTQRASNQLYQLQQQRKGNGRMALSGVFTGDTDSVIDVEVLSGPVGALRASDAVVTGVGNGAMVVDSIDAGAVPQTLRFTLLDAGTEPTPALLDFFGVQLAARAIGAAGNAVSLSVTRNLTFTDLPFATLEAMSAGSNVFDGLQYDWGQPAATGTDIPEAALRMGFTGLPTVHRAWKNWDSGRFMYRLDPPLGFDVPENTRIRQVDGNYTLTLTDGVSTEVYAAVTMYDFLAQLQARSALVQVLGVVAQDRAPGGQAVTDIPLRTDAHALPVIASVARGTATMQVGAVATGAATQNVTVTCLGNTGALAAGAQSWSVSGGVVGDLPAAYTGVLYTDGPVQFTIERPVITTALESAITTRFLPTARAKGEGLPAICFKPLLLGSAATDKEVTFEYRQRPPEVCSCSTATALKVNLQCLGLDPGAGGDMDVGYQTRLIELYEWHAGFVSSNVALIGLDQSDIDTAGSCTSILADALAEVYGVPAAATAWDGVFAQMVAELAPYADLSDSGFVEAPDGTSWSSRSMAVGATYTNPANHHTYLVTAITVNGAAISVTPVDSTLPVADREAWLTDGSSFTVAEEASVTLTVTDMGLSRVWGDFVVGRIYDAKRNADGVASAKVRVREIKIGGVIGALPAVSITWDWASFNSVGLVTGYFTNVGTGYSVIVEVRADNVAALPAGATVMVDGEIVNSLSRHCYRVDDIKVGAVSVMSACVNLPGNSSVQWLTTGAAFDLAMPVPARSSLVLTVTDKGFASRVRRTLDQIGLQTDVEPYVAAVFMPNMDIEYNAFLKSEYDKKAAWEAAAAVTRKAELRAHFANFIAYFPKKYAARMDWVRAIAGISPKTDASSAGSPCWHDFGDAFLWEDVEGFYLPAFTNRPFVSARRDGSGATVSTREFGFGLITQCGSRLKVGDRITIKMSGSHNTASWASGDRFVIPVIAAVSAPLTGGADGDATQTWTARSSVLGELADWAWLASAPTPWAHAPATVNLSPGGIAFEVGDSIAFDIDGGVLRWRRDAGAWNTEDLYGTTPIALGNGLLLTAQPGAAPSFLGGDAWQFSAVATHGTARMRQPRIGQAFAWDGASVVLDIDLLVAQPLEAVMLAMHSIAAGATVVISGGLLAASEWTLPADVNPGIILAVLPRLEGDPPAQARFLRVSVSGSGSGGSIGWLWTGMGWQPTVGPSRMTIKRQYGLSRGSGINPAALYRGAGTGGRWSWDLESGAALLAENAADLLELIDYSAAQGLEPMALVPDLRVSAGSSIALIDADEIELNEFSNWQDQASRVVSLELPLRAVLA